MPWFLVVEMTPLTIFSRELQRRAREQMYAEFLSKTGRGSLHDFHPYFPKFANREFNCARDASSYEMFLCAFRRGILAEVHTLKIGSEILPKHPQDKDWDCGPLVRSLGIGLALMKVKRTLELRQFASITISSSFLFVHGIQVEKG